MKKDEVLIQVVSELTRQLNRDVGFRLSYLDNKSKILTTLPRLPFFQFDHDAFWMSVYSTINWMSCFKFKMDRVPDKDIVDWLTRVSSWPEDIILAFWECGRHPIAHTGTRSFFHSSVAKDSSGQSKRMYIILSIDEPDVYQQGSDYIALPISQKGDVFRPNSKMPGQQVLFFYKPIPNLIWALFSDIKKDIKLSSYQNMLSYQRIYRAIPFIQDEGEIGRINNYLEIYPRLKV